MNANFGTIEDKSKAYGATIKVLPSDSSHEPTFSIELAPKNQPHQITSFRQDKKSNVDDFLCAQIKAYGRWLAEKEYFLDIDKTKVDEKTMTELEERHWANLAKRMKMQFFAGVGSYFEPKLNQA